MPGKPGELPKYPNPPDPAYPRGQWSDGTAVTEGEYVVMKAEMEGASQEVIDMIKTGFPEFQTNPAPDTTVKGDIEFSSADDPFALAGYLPKQIGDKTPGSKLDTSQADEDRTRLESLLGSLQQQATTGGGAWEESLKTATQQAGASAEALGQSRPGVGYQSQLRNIGNAHGAIDQRAVGQGNILREKSKQGAQDQLTKLTSGMGRTDANKAASESAVTQGVRELNMALVDQSSGLNQDRASAMSAGFMSEGGEVPGRAKTFGDNEKNDTVPAWLSPGEIVLPRSVVDGENAPEKAAQFVAALNKREAHAGHFAEGGEIDQYGLHQTTPEEAGTGNYVGNIFMPHVFGPMMYDKLRGGPQAPSVENGGLLNTTQYDASRQAQLGAADLQAASAAGKGPSVAPQMMQNTSDANIAAAMQAQASGRGPAAGDTVMDAAAAQQGAAGQAAGTVMGETQAGQRGQAMALLDQQERDLAFTKAKQQAAYRNTMMNVGMGLEQQQQLRNLLSGAGQAAQGISEIKFDNKGSGESGSPSEMRDSTYEDSGFNDSSHEDRNGSSGMGDFEGGDEGFAWRGGKVKTKSSDNRAAEFVRALARGGRV